MWNNWVDYHTEKIDEALLGRVGLGVNISSKTLGIFILELRRMSYRYQFWDHEHSGDS